MRRLWRRLAAARGLGEGVLTPLSFMPPRFVFLEGPAREAAMEGSWREWNQSRERGEYFAFLRTLMGTAWGRKHWRAPALLDESGRPAATMFLYDVFLRLGASRLRLGGVGSFTVLPERRKAGIGRLLMDEVHAWLMREKYDGAILFSAIGEEYYARMGYETLPEQTLEAEIGMHWLPERAGATASLLRDFRPEDLPAVRDLYNAMTSAQGMALLRDDDYWEVERMRGEETRRRFYRLPLPRPFLVGERDGRVVSYLRTGRDHADGALLVLEYGFEPGAKGDLAAMLALARESLGAEAPALLRGRVPTRFANLCPSRDIRWKPERGAIMMIKSFGGFRVPAEMEPDERFVWSVDGF